MRYLLPLLLILSGVLTLLPGCEPKEDLFTTDSSAKLEFSADTVLFDTVFAQVGTVTKRLWVYNRNSRAVKVEQISLANPAVSDYSIIVNGDAGPAANNVEIRGKDSLLVLVRAKLGPGSAQPAEGKPFLVVDQLRFKTNGNDQAVQLVAYGQNAYFHTGALACGEVWRGDKPHVLPSSVLVPAGCVLTIEAGARVYAHAGAAIIVKGTLQVNPTLAPTGEQKPTDRDIVRFSGDRRESFYDEVPGQWAGIQFDSVSSRNNIIRYAEIKNASFGLLVYNPGNQQPRPKVTVENTIVKNISGAGLSFAGGGQSFDGAGVLSIAGEFTLTNCLFTNCGEYAILGLAGGTFNLNFCTIANYTPQFRRETESVRINNASLLKRVPGPLLTRVTIRNSIIWGSIPDELLFENGNGYADLTIRNSVLRTQAYKTAFAGSTEGNLLNVDPKFKRPADRFGDKFDYNLDTLSAVSNTARPLTTATDLLNRPRDPATPDPGAYERKNR
ncbi:right-handed parallel beta-helix repeat-containing protein [Hymenobacter elongatus]|uniref:Right-handed parallel beta-helix repeat-containing protein n=1 Tax=Hymenobacter elongatus TaxID=877208 RepID=A0A4Z0PHN9_9BACT|nr:right-handed parallel beta-helix repeat-containing protein [Hymenobacter elongatus]TGE14269.1 right-handed parallel beta-helix repeat-containing protein [Hymenobacter elongatus]